MTASWPRRLGGLALLAISALLAVSIISAFIEAAPWPKTAGETSCAEWLDQMTVENRRGLAEAILVVLWERDGAAQEPPEETILAFANAIGRACGSWRTETISSIAAGLYVISEDLKP